MHIKQFIFCLFLLLFIVNSSSQNIIPNGSFEIPITFDTANSLGWHKVQNSDTPDYFNYSAESDDNIFNEFLGGINPKTGNAFVGIFCYRVNPNRSIKNIREYIETTLASKLEKDSLYEFEISLCLDAESNVAIKNFGVFFSQTPLLSNKDFKTFSIKPQIDFSSVFLDSTHNWITLQSFYKANGTEKYLTIGNFKSDKLTRIKSNKSLKDKKKKKKWNLASFESAAYYYLDDISLVKENMELSNPPVTNIFKEEIIDTFNLEEIIVDSAIVLENIIFEFNKSDLLPESFIEIEKLFRLMNSNPKLKIKLEGHTDNIGSYGFNLQLSIRRVQSVAKYLIDRGISPEKIEFAGYSFSIPLVSNNTDEGRRINRRVVFKVIDK